MWDAHEHNTKGSDISIIVFFEVFLFEFLLGFDNFTFQPTYYIENKETLYCHVGFRNDTL
jgi:hypothetical protein